MHRTYLVGSCFALLTDVEDSLSTFPIRNMFMRRPLCVEPEVSTTCTLHAMATSFI